MPAEKGRGRWRRTILLNHFAILLLCLFSCSVLEDRSGCPCRLSIHVTCPEAAVPPDSLSLLLVSGSSFELRSHALPPAGLRIEMLVSKQKGGTDILAAACPGNSGGFTANGFEIPLGSDCPPGLLLGVSHADTDAEEAICWMNLYKHVCRLTLKLKAGEEAFPFRVRLQGDVAGFSPSGALLEGAYSFDLPAFDASGQASAGIPRQPPDGGSLRLEILFSDEVLRSFALGEIMVRGGYDWTVPDLADASLELDYARTLLTLRSGSWSESVPIEKVL